MSTVAPNLPATERPSAAQRAARGRAARAEVPRSSHAAWDPPADRADPVAMLEEQARTRIPELVPIRHGRMLVSPFSYFRGAAAPMAADLATTPSSGLRAQVCGDAHLSNFGMFGSAERRLVFDVNDFDETAPGPWEWDVKRLAASLEVAGRENGYSDVERNRIVRHAVRSYREAVREFGDRPMLSVWYAHLDVDDLLVRFQTLIAKKTPRLLKAVAKARSRDSHQAFEKLCDTTGPEPRIISDPPLITPVEEFLDGVDQEVVADGLREILRSYGETLQPDRRHLVDQYRLVHLARKVVGVGSVGTQAWILLLLDGHGAPLFLQLKEAQRSVLEPFAGRSRFSNHGKRVVMGQRLMQASSDIFLGWERFAWAGNERDYYIRQLRDWKGSADTGAMTPIGMELWGRVCGWTLARAHARTGDRIALAAYLGKSDTFDRAVTSFAGAYADQNERDYRALQAAVASGRIAAETGI